VKANQKFRYNDKAFADAVGTVVALLLTIIIGVLVFWQVSDSIEMESEEANRSKNETTDMASTVFSLLPIVALVVVASIILAVVMGFGAGAGAGGAKPPV